MTEFLDPDHEAFGDIAGAFTDPANDPVEDVDTPVGAAETQASADDDRVPEPQIGRPLS